MGTCPRCSKEITRKGRKYCSVFCARGNGPRGTTLTAEQVLAIRNSKMTYRQMAWEYDVSRVTIWQIRSRKSWAWLDQENTPSKE